MKGKGKNGGPGSSPVRFETGRGGGGNRDQDGAMLAAIVAHSSDAIISKTLDGTITSWNQAAERIFGYTADEAVGQPITILIPPDRLDEEKSIIDRIVRGELFGHFDTVRRRKDGNFVDVSITVSPILDEDGAVVGASKIARDITERKLHETQRNLLLNELNHRVKNTLSVVQSIASQTLRHATTIEAARASFEPRLLALAHAQDLLVRGNWSGAPLKDIVSVALAPFARAGTDNCVISGDARAVVDAAAAPVLMMTFHELASNASRYGALSSPTGRVHVSWRLHDEPEREVLNIHWEESGGPPVAPVFRKGFGTRMIQTGVRGLGGTADLEFVHAGVQCRLELHRARNARVTA